MNQMVVLIVEVLMGSKFRSLTTYNKALTSLGVLIDGFEAQKYLELDETDGADLSGAAEEIARMKPDLRMPYLGTQLRQALDLLEKAKD